MNPSMPSLLWSTKRLPLHALPALQVEEQRGDDLVHVLGVPDVGLELVVHRLPDNALQTLDARHADPRGETQTRTQQPRC